MMRSQRGLTMIEVLAAMVIFSAGAVVLFGWISQTADRLSRIDKEQTQLFSELTALEYLRTLNPMRHPTGEETIGGSRFSWKATPVGGELPTKNANQDGIYVVQLYKVTFTLQAEPAANPSAITSASSSDQAGRELWLAGWRQVRSSAINDPFGAGAAPPAALPAAPPVGQTP